MENRKKILIDTDLGDDLDDAFALVCAMCLDFDIVGITTVFRDTQSRARMVKKLLKEFGGYDHVPIYSGFSEFSSQPENKENICLFGAELEDPAYAPDSVFPEDAVDFIIESCRRWGKELTVIAIGPFCNIAKAIDKDPEALAQAGKVCIMGGAYYKQYADWNVMCDVPAAEVMFRRLPNLYCIGADVTHLLYPEKSFMDILENGKLGYLSQLYEQWRQREPDSPFLLHDVLTIYYTLDPGICAMETIHVRLLTEGFAKGLTLNVESYSKAWLNEVYQNAPQNPPVFAAKSVNLPLFHQLLANNMKCYMQKGNINHG